MKRLGTVTPWGCAALVALGLIGIRSTGQTQQVNPATTLAATTELPDSPGALLMSDTSTSATNAPESPDAPIVTKRDLASTSVLAPARKYHRVVRADEEAGPLTGFDKIKLSIISRATWGELAGTTWAAGWSQWRNSRPHYGTDGEAFEKRLGALAL